MLYNLGKRTSRPLISISPKPLENVLIWLVSLIVACGIIINAEANTDLVTTLLYIMLLLMAINLFSISVVIVVALLCMMTLTATFLYQGGYQHWESTTEFVRSLTALAAITFLALRSKQAEEALLRAQAQLAHVTRVTSLGELAASIAHEVSQPLTAIISSGEACRHWLDRPVPDLGEARQSLERIITCSNRASEITHRVRALSRQCDPLRQRESLNDIVQATLDLLQCKLAQHKVCPKIDLTTFTDLISADRVQLQQVIINLIINACHAMDAVEVCERTLFVRTWVKDSEAVLEVADQGPGIPANILPHVFTPFFTTKENGLGLGLSICRSIIDFHDGRIWATAATDKGSAFRFALPVLVTREPS